MQPMATSGTNGKKPSSSPGTSKSSPGHRTAQRATQRATQTVTQSHHASHHASHRPRLRTRVWGFHGVFIPFAPPSMVPPNIPNITVYTRESWHDGAEWAQWLPSRGDFRLNGPKWPRMAPNDSRCSLIGSSSQPQLGVLMLLVSVIIRLDAEHVSSGATASMGLAVSVP